MRIIPATDAIRVEHPVFMIFGQPGICKTSLGYSCQDPLLLDFDKGAHRAVNRRDTLVIDAWSDVVELMGNQAALDPYATVVVDTVGRCLDLIVADIAATDPKKAPGGTPTLQGYGLLKTRFRAWTAQLRTLGKDVLLIAHDKEDKDGDTRVVRPDITGGSYGEVMKVADFVGYGYMSGKDRILDFNPTDRWIGKNPGGWAPFKVPAPGKAQSFMAELFDRGRAALGAISEASAQVTQQVATWRAEIGALTTAAACTAAIPRVKTLGPLLQPQVAKLLLDHAGAKGFTFDTTKKVFVAPAAAAEPVGPLG